MFKQYAEIYEALTVFAQVIKAPIIRDRALITAAAMIAGDPVPQIEKENPMLELDLTAKRADIRDTLINWYDQYQDRIRALPAEAQTELDNTLKDAFSIIDKDPGPDGPLEQSNTFEITGSWPGYQRGISEIVTLNPNAILARAGEYVPAAEHENFQEFVRENWLDQYMVGTEVPDKYWPSVLAVNEAFAEIHQTRITDIIARTTAYIEQGKSIGLDEDVLRSRLTERVTDTDQLGRIEREDISKVVAHYDGNTNTAAEALTAFYNSLSQLEDETKYSVTHYSQEKVTKAIQKAAENTRSAGTPDFESLEDRRQLTAAFVALEGKKAIRALASGDLSVLDPYVSHEANQEPVAISLLKGAKGLELGMRVSEIDAGLERLQPGRGRDNGIGL